MNEEKKLTWGEELVGLTFNPSGNEQVDKIKRAAANFADVVHEASKDFHSASSATGFSIRAQEEILIAQMLAVKAVTFKSQGVL
jgi:hypothetical protein